MIRASYVSLLLLLLLLSPVNGWAAEVKAVPANPPQIQLSFAPVVRRAAPAVVNIFTRKVPSSHTPANISGDPGYRRDLGDDGERGEQSLGSGVIVDPSGTIVTNRHVVDGADGITVVLADRREFEAKLVISDERTDLAILRIEVGKESLPYLEIRDSDELEVGDIVLAIGNPFGVGQTVTSGIVSALARTVSGINDYRTFIQTDAAINPGNSGGALVSLDGKLVGINTALFSQGGGSVGIGFAIPTSLVRSLLGLAGTGQAIVRPWLGATGRTVSASVARRLGLAKPAGFLVEDVMSASPAAEAGLRPGDVIQSVDGRPIDDENALHFRFTTLAVGTIGHLGIWRAGEIMQLDIKLVAPPEQPKRNVTALKPPSPLAGASLANLSPALADELQADVARGIIVLDVPKGSAAGHLGLQPGDVLVSANGDDLSLLADLQAVLARGGPLRVTVRRDGRLIHLSKD
jgi:Do/DeqQ family serine protease